jgi:hypothetical protein
MWLPLSSSFNINETIGNITAATNPKYQNIRMMAGNSGDGNSAFSNPWMTAYQAAIPSGKTASPAMMNFGATCWCKDALNPTHPRSASSFSSSSPPVSVLRSKTQ